LLWLVVKQARDGGVDVEASEGLINFELGHVVNYGGAEKHKTK
jgi:hypothetical protein